MEDSRIASWREQRFVEYHPKCFFESGHNIVVFLYPISKNYHDYHLFKKKTVLPVLIF